MNALCYTRLVMTNQAQSKKQAPHNPAPGTTQPRTSQNSSAFERYQSKPFFGSSHWWALNWIAKNPPARKTLDIGPGNGILGKALAQHGHTEVYAVEIDAATRSVLATTYARIEPSLDAFAGEQFDLVLLMDVLEHMAEPESFMNAVLRHCSPGSKLLVSVPNIAHWSIRASLALGYFEYTERGLLDRTHLQHFTRKRICDLMRSFPSLKIVEKSSSIVPIELLIPEGLRENIIIHTGLAVCGRIRKVVADVVPGLCAYQHLLALECVTNKGDATFFEK